MPHRLPIFCCLCALVLLASHCKKHPDEKLSIAEFQHPAFDRSVHAWWHWLDNSITREGITKDLESMKKQGICTATILNVGLLNERDLGVPPVIFNSAEWFGMFEWALQEADRLGMKLGAHNCDGWSSSGGPWITPENSMKRCVWSRTILSGGSRTDLMLPQPKGNLDFYRDIRVLALPSKETESAFRKARPEVSADDVRTGDILYDGNPFSMMPVKKGTTIDLAFENDFTFDRIAIHPRVEFVWENLRDIRYRIILKSSADGRTFKDLRDFEGPSPNSTAYLDAGKVTARHIRIEFADIAGIRDADMNIGELELLGNSENPAYFTKIPCHLQKTVTTMPDRVNDVLAEASLHEKGIPVDSILDLSDKMSADGRLQWDAPQGNWEVLRIGYTSTGAQNAPATKAGTGLECDKMDSAALGHHFRSFPAKLVSHAGKFAGNTFEYLFIDSWECRYQNWTKNFMEEFEKRRHYSMIKWLPVICGFVIGDDRATERFIHDFRTTIADLIEDNYYIKYNELCRRYGVKSHAEVIYGGTSYPPLDILRSNSHLDVPMFEFWAGFEPATKLVKYDPLEAAAYEIPVHAGALYGKKVIPAEAYTGYANYSEAPWDLKLFGDRAFCSGINQMVLHSYVHQPFEKQPGITLGVFGQSFNRHNPWWEFSSQWFTYHSRVQYILQQGVPVADILYFTGDRNYQELGKSGNYRVPPGYCVQLCNLDVIMNHCRVKQGRIVLDNGQAYRLLLLPDDPKMELKTLKIIAELVRQGAVIAGPRPKLVPGNENFESNEKQLLSIADHVWGNSGTPGKYENRYGMGKVISGISLTEILNKEKISPDFTSRQEGTANLLFIHKQMGASDVYFVVNQEDKTVERECIFRISGKSPEIWDPEDGSVTLPAVSHEQNGFIRVRVKFKPKESLFFVFNRSKTTGLPVRQELMHNFMLNDMSGTLTFEGLEKSPEQLKDFSSWTASADPEVRYYSGKAIYEISFDVPGEITQAAPLFISLDSVRAGYEISLNGKSLGSSVFPGYRFDISGLLKDRGNKMTIRVANTWRNRIIGDFAQFGELRNCWTTSPDDNLPGKDMPLSESGITGHIVFSY